MNAATHPDQLMKAFARDIITCIRKSRKKAELVPSDAVLMQYRVSANPDDVDVDGMISSREPQFKASHRSDLDTMSDSVPTNSVF